MIDRIVIVVLLLFVTGLTGWLLNKIDSDDIQTVAGLSHDPDYYMENFSQVSMDEFGNVERRLRASRMVHFPDDDSTELTDPKLEIHSAEKALPWHVKAERGWVSASNEVILLYGEVEIWRYQTNGERELEVPTEDLRILPDERYAETDNPATIKSHESVTHAVGMRADFRANRLELLRQVRSQHVPAAGS